MKPTVPHAYIAIIPLGNSSLSPYEQMKPISEKYNIFSWHVYVFTIECSKCLYL